MMEEDKEVVEMKPNSRSQVKLRSASADKSTQVQVTTL